MVDTAAPPAASTADRPPPRWSRWQPFVAGESQQRHRRPADAVLVAVTVPLLALLATRAGDVSSWEDEVAQFFLDLPSWLQEVLEWVLRLGSLWAVLVLAGGALLARRWRLARDLLLAGLLAWLLSRVLAAIVDPARVDNLNDIFTAGDLPSFPVVQVAVTTAIVATAAPYVVHAVRRYLWLLPLLAAAAALSIPAGLPVDVAAALVLGVGVGAVVHLLFGSPEGRPTIAQVVAATAELGVTVRHPRLVEHPPWGEVVVAGEDEAGRPVRVTALGRDASDARLLARVWHSLWYRGGASQRGSGLERVNREALVTLLAERAGVNVPAILAVGGSTDLALLVRRPGRGRLLADVDPSEVTDAVLDRLWRDVQALHGARLAHGQLDLDHTTLDTDGTVQLDGFDHGITPAPVDARRADVANLLAATGTVAGADRAVLAAHRVLGHDALVGALGYLQPAALAPDLREAVRAHDKATKTKLLAGLQQAVMTATGVAKPEPVKLQRVTWKGLAMLAATFFGVYLLMSQVSDVSGALDEIRTASWGWVAAALVVGQLPAFTDAVATMGAVTQTLPYGPTVLLQLAQKFTGLVVPSTVGVTAMNARYLNLQGVPVATAVASGVLVSLGGLLTQILTFIVSVLLTGPDLDLGSVDPSTAGRVVLLAVIGGGALVTLVYVVPRLRALIVPRVTEAVGEVREVLSTPSKALRILGGNLGSQVLYAITLGLALEAYGESLSLPSLIVVNTASSIFAGLMPVPGGIGVAEASLAAGLMAYGVPTAVAGAAALTHRLVTFYLPPIWGWFALRWLSRHEYL